jgi:serine/threonine protein kinase
VLKGNYSGQDVVIKMVKRTENDLNAHKNRRIFREAMLLSELNHPNISMFVGLAYDPENFYYLSEFSIQRSLFESIHSEHILLTPKCIYKMLNDIASALYFLHTSKIINGNLKSRSIVSYNCWDFKISNFGPEKISNRIKNLRKEKPKSSSLPFWLPPEALVNGHFDFKGDIYSFGMLIWYVRR